MPFVTHWLFLGTETLVVALALLGLFRLRKRFGLLPLAVVLGAFQPLQTWLTVLFYVQVLPEAVVSPGAVVVFTASLFTVLLAYLWEGIAAARKILVGLLVADGGVALLMGLMGTQWGLGSVLSPLGFSPLMFQRGMWATLGGAGLLFVDVALMLWGYEGLRRWLARWPFVHLYVTLAMVLTLNGLLFALGCASLPHPHLWPSLGAVVLGQYAVALGYTLALALYRQFGETLEPRDAPQSLQEILRALTFRGPRTSAPPEVATQLYRLLADLSFFFFRLDRQGRFQDYYAPHTSQLYTLPEAFLGRRVDEVLPQEVAQRTLTHLRRALETGKIQAFTYTLPIQGEERVFEARLVPLPEGEALAFGREITAQFRAQQALRESEERFRRLAESTTAGLFVTVGERFVYVNASAERITGYTAEELMRMRFWEVVHPDFQDLVRQRGLARQRGANPPSRYEFKIVRKDGEERWVELSAARIEWQGQPALISSVFDITERKRAEEALRESEARFRGYVEQANDYIFTLDTQGRLTFVNRVASQALGYTSTELLGREVLTLVAPEARERAARLLRALWQGEDLDEAELPVLTKAGETRWLQIRGRLFYRQGRLIESLHTARDVTERKQRERFLEAQAMLAQALGDQRELQPLLNRILEAVHHAIPAAEKSGVLLRIPEGGLQVMALRGYGDAAPLGLRLALEDTACISRAVREGRPLQIEDLHQEPTLRCRLAPQEGPPLRSVLVVPLLIQARVLGAFFLAASRPAAFTSADVGRLTHFAAAAALAVENARLFEELNHALVQQTALNEILLAAGRHLDDLEALLNETLAQVRAALGSEKAALWVTEAVHGRYPMALLGLPDEIVQEFAPLVQSEWTALRRTVVQEDVRWETDPSRRALLEKFDVQAYLLVPVWRGEKAIGGLGVAAPHARHWTRQEIEFLETVGRQVGLLVERALLFAETRRRVAELAALYESTQALTIKTTLEETLKAIAQSVQRLLRVSAVALYLYDPLTQTLELKLSTHPRIPSGSRLALGEGLAGKVAQTRRTMRVDDYMHWEGRSPQYEGIPVRADLETPLVYQDEMVGVLGVYEIGEGKRRFTVNDERLLELFAAQAAAAVRNALLFEETRQRAEELAALYESSQALAVSSTLEETLEAIAQSTRRLFHCSGAGLYLYDPLTQTLEVKLSTHPSIPPGTRLALGEGLAGKVAQTRRTMRVDDYMRWEGRSRKYEGIPVRAVMEAPLLYQGELVGVLVVHEIGERERKFTADDERLLELFAAQAAAAVRNALLFEETRQRAEETAALLQASLALSSLDWQEVLHTLGERARALFQADTCRIFLLEEDEEDGQHLRCVLALGEAAEVLTDFILPVGQGITGSVARSGRAEIVNDMSRDPRELPVPGSSLTPDAAMFAPLWHGERVIGVITVQRTGAERPFHPEDLDLLQAFAALAATAVTNARLYRDATRRLAWLEALRQIDLSILSSLDLLTSLDVLLEHLQEQLDVDAAAVLLFDPKAERLIFARGRGFRTQVLAHTRLRLGQGYAGRAAQERRMVHVPDLRTAADSPFKGSPLFAKEGFVGYLGVPLLAQDTLVGVLEIFHRAPLRPEEEWLAFMHTLAVQAAIAIDRVRLFDQLRRAHAELLQAYDATIEGWARALELRDMETVDHSRRVVAWTLKLARRLGVPDEDLIHIRRGALLHDIGKMGIPDAILHKAGPLTEEEWAVMRQHPVYAYELLFPIDYLRPALDIPRYHHERWDGSGYPYGLKGEAIPLAARIFAVVDVYDALSSDRPYRKAWPREKIIAYLREQAGRHFDPRVVEAFIELLEEEAHGGVSAEEN